MRDSTVATQPVALPPATPVCIAKAGADPVRVMVNGGVSVALTPEALSPVITSSSVFLQNLGPQVFILAPRQSLYAVANPVPGGVGVFVSDAVPVVEGRMRPTRFRSVQATATSQPMVATADGGVPVLATLLASGGTVIGLDLGAIVATAGEDGGGFGITSSVFALATGQNQLIIAPDQSISLLNSTVSTIESDMVYHCATRDQRHSWFQTTVLTPTATQASVLVGSSSPVPLRVRLTFNNPAVATQMVFLSDDAGNLIDVSQSNAGKAAIMPLLPGFSSLTFPLAPRQGLVARSPGTLANITVSIAVSEAVVDPSCYLLV